jgi:adenosine kinase
MQIYVSGSLAYDRIMDFPGRFQDHILPDKIHTLNVSFTVNGLTENFGGTAGNIAYALSLLGENPVILATIGRDRERYFDWLRFRGIGCDQIKVIEDEFTAGAYIITDKSDNQITGFNPGAMKHGCPVAFESLDPSVSFAIIGPGNITDMQSYAEGFRGRAVPYLFDPGQSLPAWNGADLAAGIRGARLLVSNDYELELIKDMTGLDTAGLLELAPAIVTTLGENGARVTTAEGDTDVPAAKARQVVDPTGAGDAFRAGLIQGLIEGESLASAALRGAVCGSFAVEEYGTQTYSFTPDEFAARLKSVPTG